MFLLYPPEDIRKSLSIERTKRENWHEKRKTAKSRIALCDYDIFN